MNETNVPDRFSLRGVIEGLMVAENLGDVHDEILHLCDLAGLERPAGGFNDGWRAPWLAGVDLDAPEVGPPPAPTLTWRLHLETDSRYVVWELVDHLGVRWGWIVNATQSDPARRYVWTPHAGSFGQADVLGCPRPPVPDEVGPSTPGLDIAQQWVANRVADAWAARRRG